MTNDELLDPIDCRHECECVNCGADYLSDSFVEVCRECGAFSLICLPEGGLNHWTKNTSLTRSAGTTITPKNMEIPVEAIASEKVASGVSPLPPTYSGKS